MGEVRIVGGQWKRTRLAVPDRPGLRPTPQRVRETLFNWLGQDLTGWRCVDAFAGTGALGLEAASRGAADVVLVERDKVLVALLQRTRERLGASGVRVQQGDGIAFLASASEASFDLVLLDPPFDSELAHPALESAARAVRPTGYVYFESSTPCDARWLEPLRLRLLRHLRAGAVHAALLQSVAS